MGIKNLTTVLKKKDTSISNEIKLSQLSGKIIAIDILTFLYKYVRSVGDDWVNIIGLFFYKLYKNNIKGVCVFDGKDIPSDKINKRRERLLNSEKIEKKYEIIKQLKKKLYDEIYEKNVKITPEGIKKEIEIFLETSRLQEWKDVNISDSSKCLNTLKITEKKYKKQCIKITREYVNIMEKLAGLFGFDIIYASQEAEKLCTYLCINDIVYAVLSEDSDVIAYGNPRTLSKYSIKNETVFFTDYNILLNKINFTKEQFIDFCILCGCDYNNRTKIKSNNTSKEVSVGPIRAYNLLKEFKSIDNITNINLEPLNYLNCREIFTTFNNTYKNDINLVFTDINKDELIYFLENHNCKMSTFFWKEIGSENKFFDFYDMEESLNSIIYIN